MSNGEPTPRTPADIGGELRIALTAFATWLLEGEVGEGHEVELVDKFLRDRHTQMIFFTSPA